MTVPLIVVIGAIEPDLLNAFTDHYRTLGVHHFLYAFHFPEYVPTDDQALLLDTCRALGVRPQLVSRGPWHESTNARGS